MTDLRPVDGADSIVPSRFDPGLAYRSGKLVAREHQPVAVIVHTTGAGIPRRFKREGARRGDASPFETAVRVYSRIMNPSAHYVVGQGGECSQTVPESHIAWHVGSGGTAPYLRTSLWVPRWRKSQYAWWGARWRGLSSPVDLADGELYRPTKSGPRRWRKGAVNPNTIGIEVVPPLDDPQGMWSPECWETLVALVIDICARNAIPVRKTHVLTHSDAHPLSRTTKAGAPWDPGPRQWAWDAFAEHALVHVPRVGAV